MLPFGSGGWRFMNGLLPPGGTRGWLVAATRGSRIGKGSSKMAVGTPRRMAAMRLSSWLCGSDDGCTTSRASYSSVIGDAALTWAVSYCLFSSLMIC